MYGRHGWGAHSPLTRHSDAAGDGNGPPGSCTCSCESWEIAVTFDVAVVWFTRHNKKISHHHGMEQRNKTTSDFLCFMTVFLCLTCFCWEGKWVIDQAQSIDQTGKKLDVFGSENPRHFQLCSQKLFMKFKSPKK